MKLTMKKHLSVAMLLARSTIYPVLALLAVMAGAQIALFSVRFRDAAAAASAGAGTGMRALEALFGEGLIPWIFGGAFLLITVLLCSAGCSFGSRVDYTIDRLLISERSVFWWQVGYNAAVYVLLWAAEVAVAVGCSLAYAAGAPAGIVSGQTVFLAFHRGDFLHSLLPLADWWLWGRNLLLIAGLALATARFPMCQRRGRFSAAIVPMVAAAFLFSQGMGFVAVTTLAVIPTLWVIGGVLWAVCRKEDEEEGEGEAQ